MLFNSYVFLLAFLPATFAVYHGLRLRGHARTSKTFLVLASLFFYGWWNYKYVLLISASVAVNFTVGLYFDSARKRSRLLLILGLIFNLCLLGWYKYSGFFVDTLQHLGAFEGAIRRVALPLAISFFTFQQISYLVESYRDRRGSRSFIDYCLFVMFFPHLIAGPITHHKEMLPQFAIMGSQRLPKVFLVVGSALLILGLGKKVLIADTLASIANPVFTAASHHTTLTFVAAWLGALSYTFQLYFDFSGYSDMAIGLALLFGIRMPVNFASPYRATSIIEFWRRWHISLSRFLRNYLYIPLGGNRRGPTRRHANLLMTMALGGLWHGAGWTFIGWGLIHGGLLVGNHLWRGWTGRRRVPVLAPHYEPTRLDPPSRKRGAVFAGWLATFLAVTIAWVLFRASDFDSAMRVLGAMISPPSLTGTAGVPSTLVDWMAVAFAASMAFWAPNSLEVAGYPHRIPGAEYERQEAPIRALRWQPPPLVIAVLLGVILALVLAKLPDPGVFLYFNF